MRDLPIIHLGLAVSEGGPSHDGVMPLLGRMDAAGIERAMIGVDLDRPEALRALKDHPDRFFACYPLDPNRGVDELHKVVALSGELDIRALSVSPALLTPQVPLDDARLYPFYAKAVELGLPVCCRVGVPAEAVPMLCQHPRRIDEVCAFFPELRVVLWDDGAAPFARLILGLLRRRPGLHFASTQVAGEIPAALLDSADEDCAERLLYAGGSLERRLTDGARARFLHENARRLFQLPRVGSIGDARTAA